VLSRSNRREYETAMDHTTRERDGSAAQTNLDCVFKSDSLPRESLISLRPSCVWCVCVSNDATKQREKKGKRKRGCIIPRVNRVIGAAAF